MAYWACARLQVNREALALHCLGLAGYETYFPRLRDRRIRHGRKIEVRPALFPGYCFIAVELQWHAARWTAGVINLIMDGVGPARVPDAVIAEIRSREVGGSKWYADALNSLSQFQQRRRWRLFCHDALPRRTNIRCEWT